VAHVHLNRVKPLAIARYALASAVLLLAQLALSLPVAAQTSLRFFGQAVPNVNRVMIRIDPHVPADVGAGDFTIEFWMKANAADNTPGSGCTTGSGENWINGNIILDRAIWSHDLNGDYGLAMFRTGSGSAILGYGMFQGGTGAALGLCGSRNVGDGQWHHIAITRSSSNGQVRLYVDGQLDTSGTGPTGNVSYRDGQPSQVPPGITLNVDNYLGIGAEKYDADPVRYPSYNGFVDEVRLSTVIRYASNFTRPSAPFAADADTAALYRFDEGSGTAIVDSAPGGGSPGERRVGGNPAGPVYSSDTPFGSTPQPGDVRLTAASFTIGEGAGSLTIGVNRSGGSSGAAAVNYQTSGGTATVGNDYGATSGTLTWNDGETGTKSFAVPIVDDSAVEGSETFNVVLSGPVGVTVASPSSATVTITDNDTPPPPGTLQLTTSNLSIAEGAGSVALTVSRSGGSSGAASVQFATAAGSASAGTDFTTSTGTLNWASGDATSRMITVPIVNDSVQETTETFTLALSNASGATLGAPASATISITDDDAPQPAPGTLQFSVATQAVGEAAGNIVLTVSRTGGTSGAASVQYTTSNGTAIAGSDYTLTSGSLTWADGDATTRSIVVPVLNDVLQESAESFTLALSAPTGATLGAPASVTVTINDDDTPAPTPGTLQLTAATLTVGEAAGTAVLTVSRNGGSSGAASVQYATTAGSATAGSDFTTTSGTLTWANGDATSRTIAVPIVNDSVQEAAETFTLALNNASGATLGAPASATISITDDDAPQPTPGTLQFTTAAQTVGEAAGTIAVVVARSGGSSGAASVQYATAPGSASAGSDYTAASGTLNWASGDATSRTITVPIVNDSVQEITETFSIALSSASGATLGAPTTVSVTISDDDVPPPVPGALQFTAAAQTVGESAGTIVLTVTRTAGTSGAASVQFASAAGTAIVGSDFGAVNGTLNWADGDGSSRSITIPIVNDAQQESTEAFSVSIAAAVGASLGSITTSTITITDDDVPGPVITPGLLQFSSTTQSIAEGAGTLIVTVTRTGGASGAASVQYSTAAGSATAVSDYASANGTLNWSDGDATSRSITLAIVNDSQPEGAETFSVTLTNPSGAALGGATATTVTITDDDSGGGDDGERVNYQVGGRMEPFWLLVLALLLAARQRWPALLHVRRRA
jgi:hypothetical protein